jgi:hypothetical protein
MKGADADQRTEASVGLKVVPPVYTCLKLGWTGPAELTARNHLSRWRHEAIPVVCCTLKEKGSCILHSLPGFICRKSTRLASPPVVVVHCTQPHRPRFLAWHKAGQCPCAMTRAAAAVGFWWWPMLRHAPYSGAAAFVFEWVAASAVLLVQAGL